MFIWQKSKLFELFPNQCRVRIKMAHFALIMIVLWCGLLMIPSAVFVALENGRWTFLDAFYYCFISMTTVGMVIDLPGDNLGQAHKSIYKFFVFCK